MEPKEFIRRSILTYPSIFRSKFDVLAHLLNCTGNGYEWKNGEPKPCGGKLEDMLLKDKIAALKKIYSSEIEFLSNIRYGNEIIIDTVFNCSARSIKESIEVVADIDNRINLFESTFPIKYTISEYDMICKIPLDIKQEWKDICLMYLEWMKENIDKYSDKDREIILGVCLDR